MAKEKLTYCSMKGTPGHCFAAQVWDSKGFSICSIDSRYRSRKATKYARLFASSPDLLEALKLMLDRFESIQGYGHNQDKLVLDKARKAIKKAIG